MHCTLLQKRHGFEANEQYHMEKPEFWRHPYISLLVNCIIKWETKHYLTLVVYEPDVNKDNLCYQAVSKSCTVYKNIRIYRYHSICKPVIILPPIGSWLLHSITLHKIVHAVSNAVLHNSCNRINRSIDTVKIKQAKAVVHCLVPFEKR